MSISAQYDLDCDSCHRIASEMWEFYPAEDGASRKAISAFAKKWWWSKTAEGWLCDECRPDLCREPLNVKPEGALICHRPAGHGDRYPHQ